MAQLFGYVKGAFTGADMDKEGLVEKADGGILFLDESHRLPPEGQELLFYLLDKGSFRRFGESNTVRKAAMLIIAATTENPESSLLVTFRRRIPMVIEIPPLSSRPLAERYALINEFFHKEARRTLTSIEVSSETVRALLLFDCPGNIGQLLSVIQVACARGFLNRMINPAQTMRITGDDLPAYARKGLLKIQNRGEVENLIGGNLIVYPDSKPVREFTKENLYSLPAEIYRYIEQRYQDLQNQGMTDEVINYIIGGELDSRFKKMIKYIGASAHPIVKKDLVKIVGLEVYACAEKMQKIAERKLNITGDNLFYCLAIHLRTTLDRLAEGKAVVNPQLLAIKEDYAREYAVAREMVAAAESSMNIAFPEDEVGFIAMYLANFADEEQAGDEGRVGIVLISHGHVAEGMAEVANRLLGVAHAKSVEMSLDECPESALTRAIDAVKNADEGKGVLLLVDMGSLVTFGEVITQKTGIKTRVIARVDTVMVIETVRRAVFHGNTLEELADTIEENPRCISRLSGRTSLEGVKKPKALITLCITGEGAALKVKELIEHLIPEINEQAEIIPFGALRGNIQKVIGDIGKTKEVIAVVGTVNPGMNDQLFIPIEEIVKGYGLVRIKALLDSCGYGPEESREDMAVRAEIRLQELLRPDLVLIDPPVAAKDEIIRQLGRLLTARGYVGPDFEQRSGRLSADCGHQ